MLQKIACALVVLSAVLGARAETLTYVSPTVPGFFGFGEENAKTYKGVNLAYVKSAVAKFITSFGGHDTKTFNLDAVRAATDDQPGFYYWENDGQTLTFQLQQKCDNYLRGILIQAVQSGEDVLVSVIGRYYPDNVYGTDFRAKGQTTDAWYDCYVPDAKTATEDLPNNTQAAPMALEDLQLVVSDEFQIEVDEQWDGGDSGIVAGDELIWNGGASGTWTGDSANWLTSDGAETRWVKGCIAKFSEDAIVAVDGFKNVAGIVFGGETLVFKGEGTLVFNDDAGLEYESYACVRFENPVETGIFSQRISPSLVTPSVYLVVDEARKIFPAGTRLHDLGVLSFTVDVGWGGVSTRMLTNVAPAYGEEGVYEWEYDAVNKKATCQIRLKVNGGFGVIVHCTKVLFTETDDGIYAQALYAKTLNGDSSIQKDTWIYYGRFSQTMDVDFDLEEIDKNWNKDPTKLKLKDGDETVESYDARIYGFVSSVAEASAPKAITEIAGAFSSSATGELAVSNGVFRVVENSVVNEGAIFETPIFLGDKAVLEFSMMPQVTFNSQVEQIPGTSAGSVVFEKGSNLVLGGRKCIKPPVHIYGTATLPSSPLANGYERFSGCLGVHIHEGGVLNVHDSHYGYGHTGAKIIAHPGGEVKYLSKQALGQSDESLTVAGGKAYFAVDYESDLGANTAVRKLEFTDGALVYGEMMTWAWNATANALTVGGSAPSSVELKKIRFGQQGQTASSSSQNMIEKISVADVTGDAEADFVVSSTFYLNPGTNWDEDEYCGIEKTGAGTMLLTGTNSLLAGSFKVKEGTVAFGTHASGEPATLDGMALWMQGGTVDFGASEGSDFTELKLDEDSNFVAKKGSRVTFTDSSAIQWAEGKSLLISGDWTKRSFKIGENDRSLTSAQLAQIRCVRANGSKSAVRMSSDGYLMPPWEGYSIILR